MKNRWFAATVAGFILACSGGSNDGDASTVNGGSGAGGSTAVGGSSDTIPPSCDVDQDTFYNLALGDVTLHTACRGDGPTVVLLHGFPEFWFGWNDVMGELADSHRLIAPDQRGYNLSDKPEGLPPYVIDQLVDDIAALVDHVGAPVHLVGHDWGGVVAWGFAHAYPEKLKGLVIANAPHPNVFTREYAENPDQKAASSYITFFLSPTAEDVLAANDYALLASSFESALSADEIARYKEAWAQPGALTSSLNWYRANFDAEGPAFEGEITIEVPTLVLWGLGDEALLEGNLVGLDDYVADLEIKTYDDATHWIAHEKPQEVAAEIAAFVAAHP